MGKSLQILFAMIITLCQLSVAAKSLDDKEINRLVQQLLIKENDIPNTNIQVTTKDGIVKLSGKIDTSLQANRVIELASSIKSVIDVNTKNLEINGSKKFFSDAFITAKTKGRIKYLAINKKIAENYKLQVETTNKVVHIFGNVENEKDIEVIRNSINSIIDVESVKVNIKYQ